MPKPLASGTAADKDRFIGDLVECSAGLKGELVEFAKQPRYAKQLNARIGAVANRDGSITDETALVFAIDTFVLQYRDGARRSVLERFAAQRRPALTDDEQEMVLGWRNFVDGISEVHEFEADSIVMRNLVDDVVYRAHSNMGGEVFGQIEVGMFVIGRVVPVHPDTDAWLISGHFNALPASAAHEAAQVALQALTSNPAAQRNNPQLMQRAWDMQADDRSDFIELFETDVAVLPPNEAQEKLREHYRRRRHKAQDTVDEHAASQVEAPSVAPDELGSLPQSLLEAETVGLIYDEIGGLHYLHDFGRMDALFADPSLARDHTCLKQLREYLQDDSVPPLAIRRLVQRHLEGADPVFRALLRKPRFQWTRDGEQLLRDRKPEYFDAEPAPSMSIPGDRLIELLRK